MPITRAAIKFNANGKRYEFVIYHNLPKTFGLSLNDALESWLARTTKYGAKNLCKYIMKKQPDKMAITEEFYNKTNQEPIENKRPFKFKESIVKNY